MNETFQRHIDNITDAFYLLHCQFACKHYLREPHVLQESSFLGSASVALSAPMQGDRGDVEAQNPHILHYQCVHADVIEIADESLGIGKLVVHEYGVDCGIEASIVAMCNFSHSRKVGKRIACRGAG